MSISNLYNIGVTGVRAQRLALDVTGENIANVNTEGYSRQQVLFTEDNVNSSGGFQLGTGVKVTAIQRSYDSLLQLQLVKGGGALQQSAVEQNALQRIEPLFNELGSDGLGKAISDYFGAWQDLSTNPTGTAERQAVYTRGQILTDTFHQVSSGLQATKDIANASLAEITASVTDMAANIARLNGMITTSEQLGNGSSANELRDQRDLLVRQLGEKAGISYRENSDGTVDVTMAGHELVTGQNFAQVYVYPVGSQSSSDIYMTKVGKPPIKGVDPLSQLPTDDKIYTTANASAGTNQLSYLGELGGTLNVRDHIVPDIKAKLDAIASNLVNDVNTAHLAGFYFDSSGAQQAAGNFFDPLQVTASGISLDSALTPATIAAGNVASGSAVPGNNGNAQIIAALQATTIGSSYTSLVSEIGVSVQNANNVTANNQSYIKQISTLRESNSGVSLDEELTNLIKYQRAFEGSAKLISTATEMLDVIIGLVR